MVSPSSVFGTSMGVMIRHAVAAKVPVALSRKAVMSSAGAAPNGPDKGHEGDAQRDDADLSPDQEPTRVDDVGERSGGDGQ